MGHRALVAYERTDGQYTLHYSHWGAANLKLKHRISAESPFGGEDTDSKWAKQLLAELADGLEADGVDGYLAGEDRPSTVVEPKPRATDLTLEEIIADHLDYLHHEAFYVVSPTFEVTAYRTLKDVVGDMVDKGLFTQSTARQYLKQKLGEWVGKRQELRIPSGETPSPDATLSRS
jgi:hypothetical protein